MKVQRDKLQQYQKKITVIAARETEIARECLRRGDKKKALVALRRKKYQESLLANTDGQLERLEVLVNDVEFAKVQKDVLYGLQQGTSVLKMMQKEMGGVEAVERLLGEAEEARAYSKVRLRIKWRRQVHQRADAGTVGGERDAGGADVKCGRGRGGRGVGGVGAAGQWGQRGCYGQDGRIARGTDYRAAEERVTEREVGEEGEGAGGRGDVGGVMEWDENAF
jgi:Snf7 protein